MQIRIRKVAVTFVAISVLSALMNASPLRAQEKPSKSNPLLEALGGPVRADTVERMRTQLQQLKEQLTFMEAQGFPSKPSEIQLEFCKLEHRSADDLVSIIEYIVGAGSDTLLVISDAPTNQIILKGTPRELNEAKVIIKQLDVSIRPRSRSYPGGEDDFHFDPPRAKPDSPEEDFGGDLDEFRLEEPVPNIDESLPSRPESDDFEIPGVEFDTPRDLTPDLPSVPEIDPPDVDFDFLPPDDLSPPELKSAIPQTDEEKP